MTTSKTITVLLAEDHAIVRQGLSALLNADGHFTMVGEATNGREAVQMAQALKPDVILMDIAMPLLNGLEATRQILTANPSAKVIILSAHSDDEYIKRMQHAGAYGFLEKQSSAEILTQALCEVAQGRPFFSPSIAKRLLDDSGKPRDRDGILKVNGCRLTSRESEVLQLVAEGLANKQIAAELGISIKTVEKHRQHLMNKLNIHDTAGLTRHAIASGVIRGKSELTLI
ncbi:MAG: response regulator transcription factor [Verrucomicrobia bacterium]|nr:response regulator transcription factor [Verrucomicrobiota bacterium]